MNWTAASQPPNYNWKNDVFRRWSNLLWTIIYHTGRAGILMVLVLTKIIIKNLIVQTNSNDAMIYQLQSSNYLLIVIRLLLKSLS